MTRIDLGDGAPRVAFDGPGAREDVASDWVFSTLPITTLSRLSTPAPPPDVAAARDGLRSRAMVLVYLELLADRFTEFDAHYFPQADVPLTRLSEPKNYAARSDPVGRTVLCAELPCDADERDAFWSLPESELAQLVERSLAHAGLPIRARVASVTVRRIRHVYPVYERGYDRHFERLDRWASGLERVLSFGRQGLFAHDNTHHALYMAFAAAACLRSDGALDRERWARERETFRTHVVED